LPLAEILRRTGYSDEQITRVLDAAKQASDQAMERQRAIAAARPAPAEQPPPASETTGRGR
jgi:hypothetical protein